MAEVKEFLAKYKVPIILGIILLVGLGLRLHFGALKEIPVWYDEGSYLTYAKELGLHLDIDSGWNPRRPFLLPLLWGGLYFFGANEIVIRLTILIASMFGLFLTYKLGKEMFDENVGLLAATLSSFYWLDLFFTGRILTDVPSTALMLAGYYFFWKGYVNHKGAKYLYWGFAFLGLAVFSRAAMVLALIPILVYILFRERHRIFLNKRLWIGLLIFLVVLSPFIIWVFTNFDHPFQSFTGIGEGRFTAKEFNPVSDVMRFVVQFPRYLQWPLLVLFLVGLALWIMDVALGYDQWLKDPEVQKKIFIIIWMLTFVLFYGLGASVAEDRYLLPIFAGVFFICSVVLFKLLDIVKNIQKWAVIPIIVIVVVLAGFYQINYADMIITYKQDSYVQVKDASLWIKDHSVVGETVISQSKPQVSYYGERLSEPFAENVSAFEDELRTLNPKFVMISVFEPHPDYAIPYLQEHNDTMIPAQVIATPDNQPLVVIFEYHPK